MFFIKSYLEVLDNIYLELWSVLSLYPPYPLQTYIQDKLRINLTDWIITFPTIYSVPTSVQSQAFLPHILYLQREENIFDFCFLQSLQPDGVNF